MLRVVSLSDTMICSSHSTELREGANENSFFPSLDITSTQDKSKSSYTSPISVSPFQRRCSRDQLFTARQCKMLFSIKSPLVMAGIASLVLSSPVAVVERTDSEPYCINITIPVTISAENYVLPPTSPLTYRLIQGAFNISARYCEPQVKDSSRADTLQFLVHGLTYTKNCKRSSFTCI